MLVIFGVYPYFKIIQLVVKIMHNRKNIVDLIIYETTKFVIGFAHIGYNIM